MSKIRVKLVALLTYSSPSLSLSSNPKSDDMSSLVQEMESNTHLDAEWKRIQEKTFTRWCNEQLKYKGIVMTELSVDLCDGVNLITLLEILSQKKLGRYNKRPRIHAQRMENVDMSLDFITKTEKIRLVNIGELRERERERQMYTVYVMNRGYTCALVSYMCHLFKGKHVIHLFQFTT